MPSTDFYQRLSEHAARLKSNRFEFGRGEAKPAQPSAEDLDAIAAEQAAAEATSGDAVQE